MRRREVGQAVEFHLKLIQQQRTIIDHLLETNEGLMTSISAHEQRLRTLESFLLRGNSSPNMSARSPDAHVTVRPFHDRPGA